MRFFSWTYIFHVLRIVIRSPSLVFQWLEGRDIGAEIHRGRIADWAKIGERYTNVPGVVHGFKIYLNPEDLSPISSSMATVGVLDLSLTCLLMKLLKRGMKFVDIGANLGYYTLLAARKVGQRGMVYAFEPESLNYQLLSKSVRANELQNVQIYRQAISDTTGRLRLFKADASHPGGHSVGTDKGLGYEEVVSTTLDEFWEIAGRPRWDVLKIHVAGDDPLVLSGSGMVLREVSPMITMIFDPPKWKEYDAMLHGLFASHEVYEVVKSPFLLRELSFSSLKREKASELFLKPLSLVTGTH